MTTVLPFALARLNQLPCHAVQYVFGVSACYRWMAVRYAGCSNQSIHSDTLMSPLNLRHHRFLAACVLAGGVAVVQAATIYTTTNNGNSLGTVDTVTGTGAVLGPFGQSNCWSLAFDTNGTMYVACGSNLYTGNKTTGTLTLVGPTSGINQGMEFDASGQLGALMAAVCTRSTRLLGRSRLWALRERQPTSWISRSVLGAPCMWLMGLPACSAVECLPHWCIYFGCGQMGSSVMALMADSGGAMYAISYTNPGVLFQVNTVTAALTPVDQSLVSTILTEDQFWRRCYLTAPASIPTV